MKTLSRSSLFLAIGLSVSSPSAFSVITETPAALEGKSHQKQASITPQQAAFDKTAIARRATDKEPDLNTASSLERGTTFNTREKTLRKLVEEEESLSDTEETWPVKIRVNLPEVDFDAWQQQREKVQQDFREEIEKISRAAITDIAKFREIGATLMREKKYNEVASLSGAYGNIITAQRALPSSLPEGTLSMLDAIKLELGLQSLKTAMLQATLKYQKMLGNEVSESEMEERTTNKSLLTSRASLQGKLSGEEIEIEKRNHTFQQRATALENYASKTLETIYDCFSIFTSGSEFADQTDTNDLAAAYDKVETAAWVLHALKATTINRKEDPWLQEEKQEIAIKDFEQAIQEAHDIAARIRNKEVYEQDKGIDEILADLQKNKDQYEAALQNEK